MSRTFIVNVSGHVIVDAEEEEDAINVVTKKLVSTSRNLGASAGFRVDSATEIFPIPKK